ncbi:MAG: hypothetical protein EBX56_10085 [Betaproteobacteria bacterium]|nr:hypothetical protein [Betaproteobacteria bacterium]
MVGFGIAHLLSTPIYTLTQNQLAQVYVDTQGLFARLNAFKRVVTHRDYCHERFNAFVQLTFSMILLRRLRAFMK